MTSKNVNYDGSSYSKYRPSYSDEIYELTYKFHDENHGFYDLAIDVGTGTGQVAVELSKKFKQVYGIDYLTSQIESATKRDNIIYQVGPGEDLSGFKDHSVDLITVGTAFHWFKHEEFFKEVKRVLKPKTGTLSIFGYFYPLLKNNPEAVTAVKEFCTNVFDKYTNTNIRFIRNMYRDIQFPFKEQNWYITPKSEDITNISLPTNASLMELKMPLQSYLHFFLTSSAYSAYMDAEENKNKQDPVKKLEQILLDILKTDDLQQIVEVEWPTSFVLSRND